MIILSPTLAGGDRRRKRDDGKMGSDGDVVKSHLIQINPVLSHVVHFEFLTELITDRAVRAQYLHFKLETRICDVSQ